MKTALITGASAGIGHSLTRLFAQDGHSMVLVARRKEALDRAAQELQDAFPKISVHVVAMDLSLPGSGAALVQELDLRNIEIDFLVNNAGFGSNGAFSKLNLDREIQMIDLNVRTLVELTHLLLPSMLAKKSGRILNVGSTAGFVAGPYMATYYATKAFVNSFSEALSEELKGTGVTCTVLAPGPTATEFAKVAGSTKSELFRGPNMASSDDVAKIGYEAMMTGQVLAVAGIANKILIQSMRIAPRFVLRKVIRQLNK